MQGEFTFWKFFIAENKKRWLNGKMMENIPIGANANRLVRHYFMAEKF